MNEHRATSPMPVIRSVAVYCSSSGALEPHFADGARVVGRALAEHGKPIVIVNHDGYYLPTEMKVAG